MGPDSQSKYPCPAGVPDRGTLVIMRILSLVREESGLAKRIRSLWSAIEIVSEIVIRESKIRGYIKRMLILWLQKGMFWIAEQRLVDQANPVRRNSWMTE